MSSRLQRITKVKEHRQKALDQALADLAENQRAEIEARAEFEREHALLVDATDRRRRVASEGGTIDRFQDAEAWLATRTAAHDRARLVLRRAENLLEQARERVLSARTALRQAELLCERISERERQAADRAEQRLFDELASRSSESRLKVNS